MKFVTCMQYEVLLQAELIGESSIRYQVVEQLCKF